jgi:probable F420-dependent oxidoreductase
LSFVKIGIHLPQYGRVSGPDAITTAAGDAEELGFADVWVSDHVVHPAAQNYPSPHLYDPLLTLAWAAAATERIGLATSVLVVPMHEPVALANQLASLDALSKGRLKLAVGVGWSEAEYDALDADFHTRGRRLDEALDLFRVLWRDDPASFEGPFRTITDIRLLPKPVGTIPIWIGGGSEPAYRRGVSKGDGFQLIGVTPEQAAPVVTRLRADRPEAEIHHLAAYRLGSTGHGSRTDPRRTGGLCRSRDSTRRGCALAKRPGRVAPSDARTRRAGDLTVRRA